MQESTAQPADQHAMAQEPWQLQLFCKSLKKQQKVRALFGMLGSVEGQRCLMITCGDNNGAMNWHFRQFGGNWSWADAERDSIAQISQLTGDPVAEMNKEQPSLPFATESFDVVMTIDVHEHISQPEVFNQELARMARPGGRVIVTTPNGDARKSAVRLKMAIGMRPEDYGHIVIGYDAPDLEKQLSQVGLKPFASSSYAGFFTEIVELAINYAYVKFLAKRSHAKVGRGQIAPQNIEQVKSVEKTIKIYSLLYPFFLLVSKLDFLDRSERGYAVIVAARKD